MFLALSLEFRYNYIVKKIYYLTKNLQVNI